MIEAVAVIAAYLVGSIPFGWLVARAASGIDIRTLGSGNIGATNIGRVLGARWGILVLVLDALKGALPTALLPLAVGGSAGTELLHLRVACGLATIVGHIFPCWLSFRGGKGVATALGVVAILSPLATLFAFCAFAITFAVWRIVSLSSVAAASVFMAALLWLLRPDPFSESTWSLAAFGIAVPALIIFRHRSNLVRLVRGEEPRFRAAAGKQEPATEPPPKREEPHEAAP